MKWIIITLTIALFLIIFGLIRDFSSVSLALKITTALLLGFLAVVVGTFMQLEGEEDET